MHKHILILPNRAGIYIPNKAGNIICTANAQTHTSITQ